MTRFVFLTAVIALVLGLAACAGGNENPLVPGESSNDPVLIKNSGQVDTQTHLWGYWDIHIDIETQEVEAVLNRQGMFTANVVNFLNTKPTNLSFSINGTPLGPDYVDVDIDVGITHPFPGLQQYDGYDVRGVFMGNGSASLVTADVDYPVFGSDQFMFADSVDGIGGPDGYTRWYNLPEFMGPGMPLFMYTPGAVASPGFAGSATLCPYKYFADSLDTDVDLFSFLDNNPELYGVFSSGATNERNYYLRFPMPDPGVDYGYAVVANWIDTETHPANAQEAVACDVDDTLSNVWYVDDTQNGGNLVLDMSLWNWNTQPSTILVESSVLSVPYELSGPEMTPVGGNDNYSTWHVEIPADEITASEGNEYWVIAEYSAFDYSNPYGIPNDAESEPLRAYFRYDLVLSGAPQDQDPICDLVIDPDSPDMPFEGWGAFIFDASASYDPDGTALTFEWDFDNDGTFGDYYNFGPQDKPVKVFEYTNQEQVSVYVTDENGGEATCSVDVDIIGHPSKNIPLRSGIEPYDLAVDHGDGDLLVYYDDRQVWKHLIVDYYDPPAHILTTHSAYAGQNRIDIAANGWFLCAGFITAYNRPMGQFYDPNGGSPQYWNFEWGPTGFVSDQYRFIDVVAWGANGVHVNDIGPLTGAPYLGNHEMRYLNLNDTNNYHSWTRYKHVHSGTDHTGFDKIYYDYVAAAESDQDGEHLWYLENTDFYTTQWIVTPVTHNGTYTQNYDGINFGTGSQTDNDDGWNDGQDLTRDDENRYYVLDELSTGDPRVKVWSIDGSDTTSLGGFGDTVTISSTPIRIDGSDFNGNVVVMHGNATDGYFISVFIPGEMPS